MKVPILKRALTIGLLTFMALASLLATPITGHALSGNNPTPVFRFYKYSDGSHFMTNNLAEKASTQAGSAYRYEGIAFYSYPTQISGTTPVYRFYNFKQGVHFYTSNQAEATNVNNTLYTTYRYEGVAYYSYPSQVTNSVAVYRFYNFKQGVHFYTSNQNEATYINNNSYTTYRYESIAYYLPTQLAFSGTGNQVTESFILPNALDVFTLNYSGSSNFIVQLLDANTGAYVDTLANEIGSTTISVPRGPDGGYGVGEGNYVMQVTSSGPWSITIDQPKNSNGFLSTFNGPKTQATQLFSLNQGLKTLSYTFSGGSSTYSNFDVTLWDGNGNTVNYPITASGISGSGSVAMSVPASGNYMLGVTSEGPWSLSLN